MRFCRQEPAMRRHPLLLACLATLALAGCRQHAASPATSTADKAPETGTYAERHAGDYATVALKADLSGFGDEGKRMLALLVQASEVMDDLYWQQSWPDKAGLLAKAPDAPTKDLLAMNFGPWDRLNEDTPILPGIGPRPAGGVFYPADMTKEEFERAALPDKASWYTLLRRDPAGKLATVPYHEAYAADLARAASLLRAAARHSADKSFASYLEMRADALLDDDFQPSDLAWMEMKTNPVDIVIGPIETYEDQLFGYKASYEGLVLVKDQAWSAKLARFAQFLPSLQQGLPVDAKYKAEKPGSAADLNAYAAIYYGGNANVGAKTIAINLPNDEEVQLRKGTRRLQLENVIRAKFDAILLPIANQLIAKEQLPNVTFDAFFEDTMFHEVAHGLGVKHVLGADGAPGATTVSDALKEFSSNFEEGKADVLGLYMIDALSQRGELDKSKLMDGYVTFLAGMLRSVRFGASDAHGKANMIRFNFFADRGAFARDADGRYRVDFDRMREAVNALGAKLLTVQGDGDYAEAKRMTETLGVVKPQLAADLARLDAARIPVDVRFEQGLGVLGLEPFAAKPE
jgi:hypothetical protein